MEARPAWEAAWENLRGGMLRELVWLAALRTGKPGQMARDDWAFVTSQGEITFNPVRPGSVGEWEYVLAHCLLHLGMDHFQQERMSDPAWLAACDLMVTDFLRSSHLGTPPPEFRRTPHFLAKSEEQAYHYLQEHPELLAECAFGTLARGRPDLVWSPDAAPPRRAFQAVQRSFPEAFAQVPPGRRPGDPVVLQPAFRGSLGPVSARLYPGQGLVPVQLPSAGRPGVLFRPCERPGRRAPPGYPRGGGELPAPGAVCQPGLQTERSRVEVRAGPRVLPRRPPPRCAPPGP